MALDVTMQRRFDVELLIVHPTLRPEQITEKLGLTVSAEQPVGAPRKTPAGKELPGNYADTRWRYSTRHTVQDQWFANPIDYFVDQLMAHKSFLNEIRTTGGRACLIIQFLGDGYLGDEISVGTLRKMSELSLEFGIECFTVPQM